MAGGGASIDATVPLASRARVIPGMLGAGQGGNAKRGSFSAPPNHGGGESSELSLAHIACLSFLLLLKLLRFHSIGGKGDGRRRRSLRDRDASSAGKEYRARVAKPGLASSSGVLILMMPTECEGGRAGLVPCLLWLVAFIVEK